MPLPEQSVLVVDDEADFARGLARLISSGFPDLAVRVAYSGKEALAGLAEEIPGVMILDLAMPEMHGLDVLREALTVAPDITVVVLTAHGTVETAVTALKSGAWDFLTKPVRREDLFRAISKGCERSRLLGENSRLKMRVSRPEMDQMLIGESAVMRRLKEGIGSVAASGYTVLVRGESGTGKELVAECIHALSSRKDAPFIRVNCPAIPEHLLESELFGHVKGAFTGAVSGRKGLFVEAAGGTLMLDEIGEIPPAVQTKLLRVLQDGEVRPVGASQSIRVDTRILAVTNEDLEAGIEAGTFREDLFYRLNVLTLRTPPLRSRKEDIPMLAAHFLGQTCREMRAEGKRFSPEALALLCRREWPGNVRELQNFVRRVAVFCSGPVVEPAHLRFVDTVGEPAVETAEPLLLFKDAKNRLVEDFTRCYFEKALEQTGGNISEAARLCGVERVSLQKILRRLGMNAGEFRS